MSTARYSRSEQPTTATGMPRAQLLRLTEVATHCGVSTRLVQSWRASGRIRVLQLGPRCLRVEPAELERFLREARS